MVRCDAQIGLKKNTHLHTRYSFRPQFALYDYHQELVLKMHHTSINFLITSVIQFNEVVLNLTVSC